MLKHLIKLSWNRKKNNTLLIIEIFFSFLILFIISSLLTTSAKKYFTPLGYDYHDITKLHYFGKDSINIIELKRQIAALPEVQSVAFLEFGGPYDRSDVSGSCTIGKKRIDDVRFYDVEDNYAKILDIKMEEGRWFSPEDDAQAYEPVIINRELKKAVFGSAVALGRIWSNEHNYGGIRKKVTYKIIGVVENYRKNGEFSEPENIFFSRVKKSSGYSTSQSFLIKTKPGTPVIFQEKLSNILTSMSPAVIKQINRLEDMRTNSNTPKIRQAVVFSTIGAFLIINVALGLFGVLWFSVSRRRSEIGLRRALGADKLKIYAMITGEVLVITTAAIIMGCIFALQVPLTHIFDIGTELYAMGFIGALLFIYGVSLLCASYPGFLASRIEPAEALHNE